MRIADLEQLEVFAEDKVVEGSLGRLFLWLNPVGVNLTTGEGEVLVNEEWSQNEPIVSWFSRDRLKGTLVASVDQQDDLTRQSVTLNGVAEGSIFAFAYSIITSG